MRRSISLLLAVCFSVLYASSQIGIKDPKTGKFIPINGIGVFSEYKSANYTQPDHDLSKVEIVATNKPATVKVTSVFSLNYSYAEPGFSEGSYRPTSLALYRRLYQQGVFQSKFTESDLSTGQSRRTEERISQVMADPSGCWYQVVHDRDRDHRDRRRYHSFVQISKSLFLSSDLGTGYLVFD